MISYDDALLLANGYNFGGLTRVWFHGEAYHHLIDYIVTEKVSEILKVAYQMISCGLKFFDTFPLIVGKPDNAITKLFVFLDFLSKLQSLQVCADYQHM